MGNGVLNSLKQHWKIMLIGLAPFIVLVIIFSLPLKVVDVKFTESYLTTELQRQPYTVQETYQDTEPYTVMENRTVTIYDGRVTYGWSYSFSNLQPNATISVSLTGVPYYYTTPIYYYTDNFTGPYFPHFWYWDDYWYGMQKVTIKMTYPEEVTKYRTVTKTREVTKYREVPVEVMKEKVVTRPVRMTIWQYLFYKPK